MAKIFLVLSIVASIVALAFGYMTTQKITEVQTKLTATKKDLADTKSTLAKTKDQLKDTQAELSTTKDALAAKTEEAKTLQGKVDELTANLATAQQQAATLQTQLDDANKKLAAAGVNQGGTGDEIFKKQMDDLKAQIAEKDQVIKATQAKADEAEARAKALADEKAKHDSLLKRPGLEGQVLAVNQGWNFAVISIGDRQGSVPNAEVLIKRGETLIAKMKITTVEPSTSIGDIEVDSVAKGQRVMPGDRVIFTGQNSQE